MKTKPKKSMMELAALCGVHVDTLHKSRRKGYCTQRLATILQQVTGIPRLEWLDTTKADPWERVLK
jgi:hypothetical protein